MNVPVHSHIVAGCVVLSTFYTDIPLLPTGSLTQQNGNKSDSSFLRYCDILYDIYRLTYWSQHVPFFMLRVVGRGIYSFQMNDVVGVCVWNVFTAMVCVDNLVGSWVGST